MCAERQPRPSSWQDASHQLTSTSVCRTRHSAGTCQPSHVSSPHPQGLERAEGQPSRHATQPNAGGAQVAGAQVARHPGAQDAEQGGAEGQGGEPPDGASEGRPGDALKGRQACVAGAPLSAFGAMAKAFLMAPRHALGQAQRRPP